MWLARGLACALGFGGAFASSGCGEDAPPGADDVCSGPVKACNVDYANLPCAPSTPPSFVRDVLPIFGASCAINSCHGDQGREADLYLGIRCDYGGTPVCTFPDTANVNPSNPQPLTQAIIDEVHANLVGAPSTTVPAVPRVVSGDPEGSFLVQKLTAEFTKKGYSCLRQDSRTADPCGVAMPVGSPLCEQPRGQARHDVIASWIAAGAPKD